MNNKKGNVFAIGICFFLFAMISFVTGLQNPMGIIAKAQFGATNLMSQLGNAANFIAYAFMGLPAGFLLKGRGYKAEVDYYHSATLAHENVEWEHIFPNAKFEQSSKWDVFVTGGGSSIFSKIRRRFLRKTCSICYMPTAFSADIPSNEDVREYIFGVFQNAKMADEVKDEVQKRFTFVPFESGQNKKYMEEMMRSESVGIHIRKGKDYTSRIWYQNTCSMEYYRNAIRLMKERLHAPRFYVFTDNPQWVKEHFEGIEYTLVEGNPPFGWGSHFDMQLMSYCKHNIISNSTYSWWGAFLNKNPEKIVILPRQWFNPESCEESTSEKVQCEGWIAL